MDYCDQTTFYNVTVTENNWPFIELQKLALVDWFLFVPPNVCELPFKNRFFLLHHLFFCLLYCVSSNKRIIQLVFTQLLHFAAINQMKTLNVVYYFCNLTIFAKGLLAPKWIIVYGWAHTFIISLRHSCFMSFVPCHPLCLYPVSPLHFLPNKEPPQGPGEDQEDS